MTSNELYLALCGNSSVIPGENARIEFVNRCQELAEMLENPEYGGYERANIGNAFVTAANKYNMVSMEKYSALAGKYYREIREFFPGLVNEWRSGKNSSEDFIGKAIMELEKIVIKSEKKREYMEEFYG